jgi:hypothetical protein
MFSKTTLTIILFLLISQFFGVLVVLGADVKFTPSVLLLNMDENLWNERVIDPDFSDIKDYISIFYKFAIGLTGILATVMIAIGGITWLTAGGAAGQIGKAKQMIGGSLVGLVLALFSYTILYNINEDIVNLKTGDGIEVLTRIERGCSWQETKCEEIGGMVEGETKDCGDDKDKHPSENCCCINLEITYDKAEEVCISGGSDWFIEKSFTWTGDGGYYDEWGTLVMAGDPSTATKKICDEKCKSDNAGNFNIPIGDSQFYACCSCDTKKTGKGSTCSTTADCDPGLSCHDFSGTTNTCQECLSGGVGCADKSQCCSDVCSGGWFKKDKCKAELPSGAECNSALHGNDCTSKECQLSWKNEYGSYSICK